jgi:Zn-dependent peptidase ImmA (M78 family)
MSNSLSLDPRLQARRTLLRLFESMKVAAGPPSQDEFFPVRLDRIVREILGWELAYVAGLGFADFGRRSIQGKCLFDERKILIDSAAPDGAKRFSLAHEIGHAVLHKNIRGSNCGALLLNRIRSVQRGKVKDLETRIPTVELEADVFAAELLMPEKAARRQFERVFGVDRLWIGTRTSRTPNLKEFSESIAVQRPTEGFSSLVEFFGVSQQAMARRVRELRLVYD